MARLTKAGLPDRRYQPRTDAVKQKISVGVSYAAYQKNVERNWAYLQRKAPDGRDTRQILKDTTREAYENTYYRVGKIIEAKTGESVNIAKGSIERYFMIDPKVAEKMYDKYKDVKYELQDVEIKDPETGDTKTVQRYKEILDTDEDYNDSAIYEPDEDDDYVDDYAYPEIDAGEYPVDSMEEFLDQFENKGDVIKFRIDMGENREKVLKDMGYENK